MPIFLEQKLKKQYPNQPDMPYKVMNAMGAMRGNQVTAKGRRMERKHMADMLQQAGMRKQASRKGS